MISIISSCNLAAMFKSCCDLWNLDYQAKGERVFSVYTSCRTVYGRRYYQLWDFVCLICMQLKHSRAPNVVALWRHTNNAAVRCLTPFARLAVLTSGRRSRGPTLMQGPTLPTTDLGSSVSRVPNPVHDALSSRPIARQPRCRRPSDPP